MTRLLRFPGKFVSSKSISPPKSKTRLNQVPAGSGRTGETMISLCWVLGLCKLAAAGIIPVFFFFFPRCVVLVEMESVLVHCSAATLPRPRPRGRTRRRHTQVRAATDWAPTHCCLPASSLFLVLDRKNQMVMDGMDNRVRSAIMPLCLPFSGREERTWLWPLGLGGRECVCRWTVVPPSVSFSAVLSCAPWRRRVSRLWVMATCTAPPPRKVGA